MTDYKSKYEEMNEIDERIAMLFDVIYRNIDKRSRKTEELIEYAYGEFMESLDGQGLDYPAASKRRDKFYKKAQRKLYRAYQKRNNRIHLEIKRLGRSRRAISDGMRGITRK